MKKLISALLLCSLLLSLPFVAPASGQEMIDRLIQVVEDALNEGEYIYTYDADYECFELEFDLDSTIKSTDVTVYIYDDMVSVTDDFPLSMTLEHRDRMALLLTLINNDIYYAQFRMDYDTAHISCRSAQIIDSVVPGAGEIYGLIGYTIAYMEKYGDTIARVSLGGDPFDAYSPFIQ